MLEVGKVEGGGPVDNTYRIGGREGTREVVGLIIQLLFLYCRR